MLEYWHDIDLMESQVMGVGEHCRLSLLRVQFHHG